MVEAVTTDPSTVSLEIDSLTVDPDYQRSLDERFVARLVAEFNPLLMGELIVNRRDDGSYRVIDGQHRLEAARRVGLTRVRSALFLGLSPTDEAVQFSGLNRLRRSLSVRDAFRARVYSGDPVALDLVAVANEAGYRISRKDTSPGYIDSPAALEKAYTKLGRGGLLETLRAIQRIWGNEPAALSTQFITGMAMFARYFPTALDGLEDAVGDRSATSVLREAKGRLMERDRATYGARTLSAVVAIVLREVYNKGKRGRAALPQMPYRHRPNNHNAKTERIGDG